MTVTAQSDPAHLDHALRGLAENPVLPVAFVRRLFAFRDDSGTIARRADLTAELVAQIVALDDWRLLCALARNPVVTHEVRMRLARHPHAMVRSALIDAVPDAPRELFEALIDDPDLEVRTHIAQSDSVHADLRARLAADPEFHIRMQLAEWWPQAPEDVRRILLTDEDANVRAAACSPYFRRPAPDPVMPADLLPALLEDPWTRAGAARYAHLDVDAADRLARDPSSRVREELAQNPTLPAQIRDALAEDSSASVRVQVFARADTPEPVRAAIHAWIRSGAHRSASVSGTPEKDLSSLAAYQETRDFYAHIAIRDLSLAWVTADPLPYVDSPYTCFRASAAESGSLPPGAVARLLNDEESRVRTAAAIHAPHLVDAATAERIDREYRPSKKTRWRPADEFTFPPDYLRRFATDPDPRMRRLAPRDLDLPGELAELLAADASEPVRQAVAAHPGLPPRCLPGLLADTSRLVVRTAARSPVLPIEQMERLLALAGL